MIAALRVAAVVLAGGAARRFGADKLAAAVDGIPLLERAVADLPEDWFLILVGPERPFPRSAVFTREEPAGGGPAAALVAGARAAVAGGASTIVTLPGDAPRGGTAARALAERMHGSPADLLIAVDPDGVEQPLQLCVRGAALDALAGRSETTGLSARRLVSELSRQIGGHDVLPLPADLTGDVDTPEDLGNLSRSQP